MKKNEQELQGQSGALDSSLGKCGTCGLPSRECVCCESCGHVCPLDRGEPWCPVCKPEAGE